MSTPNQTAANQQNAQSSTGPRTGAGKTASSQNSTCHGLSSEFAVLSHENAAEFSELFSASAEEFQPAGVHEEFLVRRMVEARWRATRCQRLENAALEAMLNPDDHAANPSPDARIVDRMNARGDLLTLLQRYSTAAIAQYDKAHRELIQSRKQQSLHERQTLDHYIKNVVFAPMPDEQAVGESAARKPVTNKPASSKPTAAPPPQNGFVSQNAPASPETSAGVGPNQPSGRSGPACGS